VSEATRQFKRIEHIVLMTGMHPNVLDIAQESLDRLIQEAGEDPRQTPSGFYKGRMTLMTQSGRVELVVGRSA
jgi:hypothetical protein